MLAAIALLALGARAAAACSLRPIWGIRDTAFVAFIGTALADTVLAGPGTMAPASGIGHYGRGAAREAYGQRFRLDELGAQARARFPADVREVVIVPWDYDAGCSTVPWGRSARWIAPGTSGLYRARLRAREHWVGDLPTFDMLGTAHMPYGPGTGATGFGREVRGPWLSPQALLRFYDELPPRNPRADSTAALALMRRLTADSAFAAAYPVREVIGDLVSEFQTARERAVVAPVAGTFRLELSRDGGAVDTLYLRLDDGATTLDPGDGPEPGSERRLEPPTPRGYYIYASATTRLADLAPDCHADGAHRLAYVDLDWHAPTTVGAPGEWRGGLDERFIEALLPADSIRAWRARKSARWKQSADSIRAATAAGQPMRFPRFVPDRPLRFTQATGAPMRVEGVQTFDALGTFRIRGERISLEVLPCEW